MRSTLLETLKAADQSRTAIGHFNISDSVTLQAVAFAARDAGLPVIVGLSEDERKFFGTREAAVMVNAIRDSYGQTIFINADHTHSLESAIAAVKAGFDSVVFDRSALSFEENIRETKHAVETLKSINPAVVVEGESGDIGTGSQIHEKAPEQLVLTTPEEARQFVEETRVDVLSPAVGNMHGMLKSMLQGARQKRLNVPRIRELKAATGIFMTLHGGSGTNDADLQEAIQSGMTIIHINTELRVAWRKAIENSLARGEAEVVPYKLLDGPFRAVQAVVRGRLAVFNSTAGRAFISSTSSP
jgi:fructose-bisphosphate aldolase class II